MTDAFWDGQGVGGVANADAQCALLAAASKHPAVHGKTFRAWLSVPGDDVASRLVHGTLPYVLPMGMGTGMVAANWNALTNVDLLRAIDRDQYGNQVNSLYYVWTGSSAAGAAAQPNCQGFTSNEGNGVAGATFTTEQPGWSAYLDKACAEAARLYCVEE